MRPDTSVLLFAVLVGLAIGIGVFTFGTLEVTAGGIVRGLVDPHAGGQLLDCALQREVGPLEVSEGAHRRDVCVDSQTQFQAPGSGSRKNCIFLCEIFGEIWKKIRFGFLLDGWGSASAI